MAYNPQNPNGQATSTNSSPVVIASDQSTLPISIVSDLDSNASGTLTASGQVVALTLNGKSGVSAQITGTWVGTLQFEATVDGTTYQPINAVQAGTTNINQVTTVNGLFRLTPSGLTQMRVNMTAFTSGSAVVTLRGSSGAGGTFLNQSLPSGANILGKVSIDQTTPGTTNAVSVTNTNLPVTGTFFQATQPVSLATNTPTLQAGSTTTVTQATGTNLHAVIDSGTISSVTAITNALPTGANIIGKLSIDQTTPGTTNLIQVGGTLPSGANTIGAINQGLANTLANSWNVKPTDGFVSQGMRADGFARMVIDPTTLLFDTFEILNTTDSWTAGGTTLPTVSSGALIISAGVNASASSYTYSKASFIPGASAYLQTSSLITLQSAVITGAKCVWGLGVIATTPTSAIPVANGTVFEILDTDGALYGAVYSNNVRTQSVALTRPTDGLVHRYAIYYKASRVYFEIDNIAVGSIAFPNPSVSSFPAIIGTFNGTTAITTAPALTSSLLAVADTGRNSTKISDGVYPWRMQTVKMPSVASVATDMAAVVALHPTSPLPVGTNVIGKVSIDQTTPGTTNAVSVTNTSLPVTGAFFQTTQPVSLASVAVTQATGTNLHTVIDSGTITAITNALPTGANTIGAVNIASAQTLATVTTVGAVTAITNALPIGANIVGKVGIDQTTQGVTNAVSVISQPELVTTGTITTTDIVVGAPSGTGTLLSGTSTAGSYVSALATGGNASVVIGITGLTSGTIYYEGSADSTTGIDGNWVSLNMKQAGVINTQISSSATTNGLFRGNTAGIRYVRMRSVGTLTGTPAITLRLSTGVAGEFLFGSIPTGTNTIGAVNISASQTLATVTTVGAVTAITNALPTGANTIGAVNIASAQTLATVSTVGAVTAITNALPTGANTIGAVNIAASQTLATVSTVTAVTAITNALPTGANKIGTVDIATAPAVAKGTQGANALPTQSMKDSGRVGVAITCYQAPGIITTEALFAASTFAVSRDGGTPTAVTQFTVTTGKRFVVQSIVIGIKNNAAAAGTSKLVLRYSGAAGTIATTSSVIVMLDLGSNSATAGAYIGPTEMALPDGMELISGSTFGFTNLSSAITMLHTITINGFEY